MLRTTPSRPTENKETEKPASYGGGPTRLAYEKKEGKAPQKMSFWLMLFGIVVVAILALVGMISLFTGSLFSAPATAQGGTSTALKVPTNADLADTVTPQVMIESVQEATVTVHLNYTDGRDRNQTGFIVSQDGYAVTGSAGFKLTALADITVFCGDSGQYPGALVGLDSACGIAVIKLQTNDGFVPLSLGNSDFVKPGERVYAVGDVTEDVFRAFTLSGAVSAVNCEISVLPSDGFPERTVPMIYTDFAFNATLSGAPLVNESGQVIGFCTLALAAPYSGMGSVVPVNTLVSIINAIIQA